MKINKIDAFILSDMIMNEFGIEITSMELQFLNRLKEFGRASTTTLAKEIDVEHSLIDSVFSDLMNRNEGKHIVSHSSPWRIGADGIKIVEFSRSNMGEIDEFINKDPFLNRLKHMTRSI